MYRWYDVGRAQRLVVVKADRVVRVLGPGRQLVWAWEGDVVRVDLTEALHPSGVEDALPVEVPGTEVFTVRDGWRAVVRVDGILRRVALPGTWRIWHDTGQVEVTLVDTLAEPMPLADTDRLGPDRDRLVVEATAGEGRHVVLVHDGVPVRTLSAGRYRVWRTGPWSLTVLGGEQTTTELAAQDVVTLDQVPVRVKVALRHRVGDALTAVHEAGRDAVLYGVAQRVLREVVAATSLEALTTERAPLSVDLYEGVVAALPDVGLVVEDVWVKDVILSAEVKANALRVTAARAEAQAEAIRRREEVASMRQLANTARLLEANPILVRLKELEALTAVADRVDKLVVVGGLDGLAAGLRLADTPA